MRLKKLQLFGFKTFPEPAELYFPEGTTAIVGPNGCGKSNIIDAIRWVMGETSAKGLRGDSMEDVIFSGSESRKPLNLAEVTLTLTGAEGHLPERFGSFHEVAVTRRLHRSGESEYLINKVQCRLKDITELFMDTGVGRRAYSVVEQGRIDAILSAKPQERRSLIEEAAGITKYRSRKDEAVRKMEETAQNLQRLGDVIGEVRREMNLLKRQAARATEFKTLRSERRTLERHLLVAAWQALHEQTSAARAVEREREGEAVAARALSERLGARLEQGRLALLDEERALEARQREVYGLRSQIAEREGREAFLSRDLESLTTQADRATTEAAELGARGASLAGEVAALEEEARAVAARVEAGEGALVGLTAEHAGAAGHLAELERALDGQKRTLLAALGDLTRANHGLDHAVRQEAEGRRRLEGMGRQEAELVVKLREVGEEVDLRASELAAAESARVAAVGDRAALDEALSAARARRQDVSRRAEAARKALHTDQSRLKGLEQIKESLEGYGAGVKAILQDAKRSGRNGIHGVVADTISAPPQYESALEAALGERLQYVIVENSERGADAVRHLKAQRAGRSSFAPVSLRAGAAPIFPEDAVPGALGPLLELVTVAPEYRPLAQCLLGDVFVVETLEGALALWERNGIRATLVTLEGDTLSPEGVISGGAGRQDGAGLLRKNREIRELREVVTGRVAELEALDGALVTLEAETDELQSRFEAVREEVHRRELQVAHLGKDVAQLRERQDRLQERREAMEFERDDLGAQVETLRVEVERLEAERARHLETQQEVEARVEGLQTDLSRAREAARGLEVELTRRRVEQAADRQRHEGLGERIRSLAVSRENVERRVGRLGQEIAEAQAARELRVGELERLRRELSALRVELGRQEAALSALLQGLDERRGGLSEEEKAAGQARRDADEAQRALAEAQLSVRELGLRSDHLVERYRERQQGDLAEEAGRGVPEGFDAGLADARIAQLDEKIAAFGEINLLAIEEYEDRKCRFEFLEFQRKDLEESLESLRQAIQRINRVSRERFGETFERVSRTFQELYPRIFRGGEARLVLTDPDNLLETGIDIVARPPGKRAQHISLLSGGEKALTAVALIFSIFLVKPSPFCILDEVDAPLDEANIGRFTEMVRTLACSSQFLIITHNKSTMEAADHLYGITMPEPGISRAVSVRLGPEEPAKAA
ncbi:MAG: chromosome segregation protein SMC [Deltaproteobacteria bacterium]|nr:chromosome segregation protein SMC [Deltaproteobacteria bacterium]